MSRSCMCQEEKPINQSCDAPIYSDQFILLLCPAGRSPRGLAEHHSNTPISTTDYTPTFPVSVSYELNPLFCLWCQWDSECSRKHKPRYHGVNGGVDVWISKTNDNLKWNSGGTARSGSATLRRAWRSRKLKKRGSTVFKPLLRRNTLKRLCWSRGAAAKKKKTCWKTYVARGPSSPAFLQS